MGGFKTFRNLKDRDELPTRPEAFVIHPNPKTMNFAILKNDVHAEPLAAELVRDFCDIPEHWLNRKAMVADVVKDLKNFDWDQWATQREAFMADLPGNGIHFKNAFNYLIDEEPMAEFLTDLANRLGFAINADRYTDTKFSEDYLQIYKHIERYVESQNAAK